jgi:hypothetical protein
MHAAGRCPALRYPAPGGALEYRFFLRRDQN